MILSSLWMNNNIIYSIYFSLNNIYIHIHIMPFIGTYNGAMQVLSSIGKGTCKGECKSSWIRNFKYALKTKTNPLKLN